MRAAGYAGEVMTNAGDRDRAMAAASAAPADRALRAGRAARDGHERHDDCARRRPELSRLHAVGGWSATLRLPARRDEEEWALELLRRDVIVHPGHFYDFDSEPFLVMSLIVEPGTLDRGLARLEELVAAS